MMSALEELDQEPFNTHEFVERLAWRTMGTKARTNPDEFNPMLLHDAFESSIKELKAMNHQIQQKVERLEAGCKEEEKGHWQRVAELQRKNQNSHAQFTELDERINFVATKVVHLGDQLEGVNTPRARAVEAQRLMNFFSEFLSPEPLKSQLFTGGHFQLQLSADIIQKLHLIALELPRSKRFDRARDRIAQKYDEIEKELIDEFRIAHHDGDRRKMKRVAAVLKNFKGYTQCIDAFIEECQKGSFIKQNTVFIEVLPLCQRTHDLINDVFISPESVMAKLVQNIYQHKLQNHISKYLETKVEPEQYLKNLYDLYNRTNKLSSELSVFKMGNDSTFLNKLTKNIFVKHLESYIGGETKYLRDRCTLLLQRYYDGKEHQKRQIQTGGIYDLRRDIQAKLGTVTKANINIGPTIENYGGETFLSQEVAINILQETKIAFKRCQMLSSLSEMPVNAVKIFDMLVQFLVTEHIDYAVELGLQAIPLPDPKTPPEIYFFDIVGQANTLFHLVEKQFLDSLVPLILSSPRHSECIQKKKALRECLETKIDTGLDKSVQAIVGWVKFLLATEQKKTDFKSDADDAPMLMLSPACAKVVKFMNGQIQNIQSSLDGKNVEVVFTELGSKFHRLILEHVQQYQYSSLGAMLVICDVNEYRKCVKVMKIPLIMQLFEKLHALCNLLVVVPDNLRQICNGEQLAGLDKSVLQNFLQLRADYKTSKLATVLK